METNQMEKNRKENQIYQIGSLQGKRVKQTLKKKYLPANVPLIVSSTPQVRKRKLHSQDNRHENIVNIPTLG
jgi:hypothetical protein